MLTLLLPSTPYTLAYTLPLLLVSILLLFAGSFLTLDRTRSFPPQSTADSAYSSLPGTFDLKRKKGRFTWALEGGIGGLGFGFVFGVHLSTFLSLLIPSTSSAPHLSPQSFLAIWILSALPTTLLGGRYRSAALVFAGIAGGTSIALGLALILHPSLLPRQILLGVFALLFLVLVLVSSLIPRLSAVLLRPVLRTSSSALGAFGLVLSIALLSKPRVVGWANVWDRLWVQNGDPKEWGTGREKGLSAAWAVFWVVGVVVDWALGRWVGECPDEKWDNYLSKYATDLPNHPDRAGTFQPLQSFWDKLFSSSSSKHSADAAFFLGPPPPKSEKDDIDIIFPSTTDTDSKHPHHPRFAGTMMDAYYAIPPPTPTAQFKSTKVTKSRGKVDLEAELLEGAEDVAVPSGVAFLRKKTSGKRWKAKTKTKTKTKREPVKFGNVDELSSSESESEGESEDVKVVDETTKKERKEKGNGKRPWIITNQQPSYSSDVSNAPTLVEGRGVKSAPTFPPQVPSSPPTLNPPHENVDIDYDKELERLQSQLRLSNSAPVYSSDEDVESPQRRRASSPRANAKELGGTWSPAFLQRHKHRRDPEEGERKEVKKEERKKERGEREEERKEDKMLIVPGSIPVPATPSLIRAVDRIVVAQREVFGAPSAGGHTGEEAEEDARRLRIEEQPERHQERKKSWDTFWREVRDRAGRD